MLPLLDPQTGAVKAENGSLVLEKPFVVGWYGCPVFLAKVQAATPIEADAEEAQHVVVKLMYFDARARGENISMDDFDFLNAIELVAFAKAEADAYAALEQGQGSILPYCYGFYEVLQHRRCITSVL